MEPKDMFNATITDWLYLTGGLLRIRAAVREGRHDDIIEMGPGLAQALHDRCKYEESLEVWEAVHLSSGSVVRGDQVAENKVTADAMMGIGFVYEKQGKYDKALDRYTEALEMRTSLFGPEHVDVAASYFHIGSVYHRQDKYEEALEMHQQALQVRIKVFNGHEHMDVTASYNNIGNVYDSQGKYEEALEMHQKVLEIRIKVDVARSYGNIGNVYESLGKYDEALAEYNKCLKIQIKVFNGYDHTDVAASYSNIGLVYNSHCCKSCVPTQLCATSRR